MEPFWLHFFLSDRVCLWQDQKFLIMEKGCVQILMLIFLNPIHWTSSFNGRWSSANLPTVWGPKRLLRSAELAHWQGYDPRGERRYKQCRSCQPADSLGSSTCRVSRGYPGRQNRQIRPIGGVMRPCRIGHIDLGAIADTLTHALERQPN